MFAKRYLRFSIGAMLVLMAGVAVLLNHEVQRAKAIEVTVDRIEWGMGKVFFTRRKDIPSYIANVLPGFWGREIKEVSIRLFIPKLNAYRDSDKVDSRNELISLFELGGLKNMREARLIGSGIDYSLTSKLCEHSSMKLCSLQYTALTEDEINKLEQAFPRCEFRVIERSTVESPN